MSGRQDSLSRPIPHQSIEVEDDGDDDDEENRVVETDPTGRFQRFNKSLGKGAYKEVFKAFDDEEGFEVAWNRLRLDHLRKQDAARILSEIQILQSLRNENIINLFSAWTAPSGLDGRERVIFITELMTSGTLKSYLRRTKGPLKPKVLKSLCRQVLAGLHYLHSRSPPIIHRDLKCENIFINGNNGQAKIGDLGLAVVKNKEHVSSVLGTPEFMAPELYDEKYDEKVDIYAFGMVVIEIVTKEYPYSECTNQAQIYKKVTSGIKPLALYKITDEDTRRFVDACITFDPKERPYASDLLKHPFLQTINPAIPGMPVSSVPSSSTHSLDTVTSDSSAQINAREHSPHHSHASLNDGSLPRPSNASFYIPASSGDEGNEASRRSSSQVFSERSDTASLDRYRRASETLNGGAGMVLGMAAEALSNQGSERLVRKSSIGFSNPPSPHLSLSRTPAVRDGECKCKVTKDLADKTSDTTSILKMLYTASADDKSTSGSRNQSQREIKFPFNILEDTATDVVSEMVKESLVKEEDEPFVRRRLEEAIKEFFFFNKPGSVSGSSSSSPQLPRSQSGTELNDALQRNVSTGMLANLSLQSFPAVEAQYGDRFSPSFPRVTDESVENPEFVTAVPHVSDPQGPARTYMSRRFNLPNTDGVFFE